MALIAFVLKYFISCSQDFYDQKMNYTDISATDLKFKNFTSFADYNSTMNFYMEFSAYVNDKPIDIKDNEYIRIRTYSTNEKK